MLIEHLHRLYSFYIAHEDYAVMLLHSNTSANNCHPFPSGYQVRMGKLDGMEQRWPADNILYIMPVKSQFFLLKLRMKHFK